MNKKYLNLSPAIKEYIEYALSNGEITSKEIELIKRKAVEFGDDPDELDMVLTRILSEVNDKEKANEVTIIEITPSYGMIDSYLRGMKNYFNFKGRASRAEFWYFILFNYLLLFTVFMIIGFQGEEFGKEDSNLMLLGLFSVLFPLITIIPFLSLSARRLHDINKSGWFALIPIYNVFLFCKAGIKDSNSYGADPYQTIKKEVVTSDEGFLSKLKSNTIETIGGTMFAIGATSHEAIEFKIVQYHQLDIINKWLWIIGGVLIFIPKASNYILRKKK